MLNDTNNSNNENNENDYKNSITKNKHFGKLEISHYYNSDRIYFKEIFELRFTISAIFSDPFALPFHTGYIRLMCKKN